ncbi:MAG: aromatic ring-hydroxylating dioxygenase subunit alpha [Candidatus Obscuribacterales bacterium]
MAAPRSSSVQEKRNSIDENIEIARTLPNEYYREDSHFQAARELIFKRSWQFIGDSDRVKIPGQASPVSLLDGFISEPLLLTRDSSDQVHCLSNVCTHRGTILVEGECHAQQLRCRYHGRRFGLDGKFLSTPGFEQAKDFPSADDNLSAVPFQSWDKLLFAGIDPAMPFEEFIGDMRTRLAWLPLSEYRFSPENSRDYIVHANWALYCDNYLEGFHIPYVHPELAQMLDVKNYYSEIYKYSNLQLGYASSQDDVFPLPESSPDFGKPIAAYYYWLFPNLMFNFYPWGLSINVVLPLAVNRTKVSFLTYIYDHERFDRGANTALDRVEREDESVVEQVQKGVRSHFYTRGRYSPQWEKGVHHFHSLLLKFLNGEN